MRRKRYGIRATKYNVSEWRQENTEIAVKRESKVISFTPGPRYIVLEIYINNKDEFGEEKAMEMAYEKANEMSEIYSHEVVDMWIKEYKEKGFKGIKPKTQGDDDDAR